MIQRMTTRFMSQMKTQFRAIKSRISPRPLPQDFSPEEIADIEFVKPYTMTSRERLVSLARAVRYLVEHQIPGDFVECGVWRGGSMMMVARTLQRLGVSDRQLFLYDTFAGMSEPIELDRKAKNRKPAADKWSESQRGEVNEWCYASLEDVQQSVSTVGYPSENIHFRKGKVEDTLPGSHHAQIALLRLDTDWYESTRCEMEHLFPALVAGGVFISDDYYTWEGARQAVDEYLQQHHIPLLLCRVDSSAVIGVRQSGK